MASIDYQEARREIVRMFSAQDTVIVKSVDNVELTEAEDLWKLIG